MDAAQDQSKIQYENNLVRRANEKWHAIGRNLLFIGH